MVAVFYVFVLAGAIQLLYYVMLFSRFALHRPRPLSTLPGPQVPISVIICAKNEAHNLSAFLPRVLQQSYALYEVIVVNDRSTDDTAIVLGKLAEQYAHLRTIDLTGEKRLAGKRDALLAGIAAARYEHLLLTDADCEPVSFDWIRHMTAPFQHAATEVVLGYSPYRKRSGWLNAMIRYETVFTAMQYFSFALAGKPYMGVGRNLAYTKTTFRRARQFYEAKTISGDDDLLISEIAHKGNTAVVLHPDSYTISVPSATWKSWLEQKRRHASAGFNYNLIVRAYLGIFLVSQVLFHFLGLGLMLENTYAISAIVVFFSILSVKYAVLSNIIVKLGEYRLGWRLPILDFMMSLILAILGILSALKIKEWTK
ncbi:MAG: glycosyltransferase [Chitinophagales bacterium]|nr:glycosyltransferase [Chitinophagales bacterium]